MTRILICALLAIGLGSLPATASGDSPPPSANARCRDGSYSFSQHHSGTCSHHGGVMGQREPSPRTFSTHSASTEQKSWHFAGSEDRLARYRSSKALTLALAGYEPELLSEKSWHLCINLEPEHDITKVLDVLDDLVCENGWTLAIELNGKRYCMHAEARSD
jgi:hypothetical protein